MLSTKFDISANPDANTYQNHYLHSDHGHTTSPNLVVPTDLDPTSQTRKRAGLVRREMFDPLNKEHLTSYKNFLITGNWGVVQFFCESPYITVPETVHVKFALRHIEDYLKS